MVGEAQCLMSAHRGRDPATQLARYLPLKNHQCLICKVGIKMLILRTLSVLLNKVRNCSCTVKHYSSEKKKKGSIIQLCNERKTGTSNKILKSLVGWVLLEDVHVWLNYYWILLLSFLKSNQLSEFKNTYELNFNVLGVFEWQVFLMVLKRSRVPAVTILASLFLSLPGGEE